MSLKTSETQKANYVRYRTEGRAVKNKALRRKRHMKRHPNDIAIGGRGGRTQDMDSRPDKLTARINRAVAHEMLFGQGLEIKGRILSSAMFRRVHLTGPMLRTQMKKSA